MQTKPYEAACCLKMRKATYIMDEFDNFVKGNFTHKNMAPSWQ